MKLVINEFWWLNPLDITAQLHTQTSSPLKIWGRVLVSFIFVMAGAYGASLTLFYIAQALVGESVNFIALLNNVVHLMLLPALVLLPLTLLFRRWVMAAMLVVPFIIAVTNNAPLFVGGTPAPAPGSTEIGVLSYNLMARYGSHDESIAIIREADADIVALQEVYDPSADAIRAALADEYPHMAIHTTDYATQGQAILSRYPIVEDEFIRSYLGHQRTVLDVNGRQVAVYNVHPAHPGMLGLDVSRRSDDINPIIDMAQADAPHMPTLMIGDFNMTPNTADYAHVTETFTDAYREAGFGLGYTFPDDNSSSLLRYAPPLARIDYVFHDADWTATAARVWGRTGGSDHYPVYARLALSPENG